MDHVRFLDNGLRRFLQNPRRMFGDYVKPGDTVFDIGCGPGAFIPGLAALVGRSGTVVAIDLQEEMLQLARKKAQSAGVSDRVQFHQCSRESLNLTTPADLVVTFYMVHEAPNPLRLVDQVCALVKNGGYYYLAEPSIHVSEAQYREVVNRCAANGLKKVKEGGVFSRTAVFQRPR